MRKVNNIVLHCTAGSQRQSIASLKSWWFTPKPKGNGWKTVGYHWIIEADGTPTRLADDETVTNGVGGHNSDSIHISYMGGIDLTTKKAIDNRTPQQKATQAVLVRMYKLKYPDAKVLGHRDFPGVRKDCPSFDVKEWLKDVYMDNVTQDE